MPSPICVCNNCECDPVPHPDCGDCVGPFTDNRCWLGIFPDTGGPGNTWSGACDIGCAPCQDNPLDRTPAFRGGMRWLRPWIAGQGRDARGWLHDLRSDEPWRVPDRIDYEHAACWSHAGHECFPVPDGPPFTGRADYCGCFPGPDLGEAPCEGGAPFGGSAPLCGVVPGFFPDTNLWHGHRHDKADMQCRHVTDHGPMPVILPVLNLGQAKFIRAAHGCHTNAMIRCAGRPPVSVCPGASNPAGGEPGPEFYNDNEGRGVFSFLAVENLGVDLSPDGLAAEVAEAKRGALADVFDIVFPGSIPAAEVRFDRVDYDHFEGGPGAGNGAISVWSRQWPVTPDDVACDDMPAIRGPGGVPIEWPNCRLRFTPDCTVTASPFFRSVLLMVDFVPHQVANERWCDLPACDRIMHLWPSVRILLRIGIGIRAQSDCAQVTNYPAGCASLPTVTDDEIVYVGADGRRFEPPTFVEWHGYLGAFSNPPWDGRFEPPSAFPNPDCFGGGDPECFGGSLEGQCLLTAANLQNIEVPGRPTHADTHPDDPNRLYLGGLRIGFDLVPWCGN